MILFEQLETFKPQLPKGGLGKSWDQNRRLALRQVKKARRQALTVIGRQYYLWNALADGRRAVRLNEDIVFGSLILMAVINFAAVSILANALYTFMQAAFVLSSISGANLALLAILAFGVVIVLGSWVLAMLQNMVTISLTEGLTRKHYRSLRLTLKKSLRAAGRVTTSWTLLALSALGPAALLILAALMTAQASALPMVDSLGYLFGIGVIAILWIGIMLATFTLVPYVALFEPKLSWLQTFSVARQLVRGKGRLFIVSLYLALAAALALAYGLALTIEHLTRINSTLLLMTFLVPILTLSNATLTTFYRKRKLSRR